jgi:Nitroreductase family
MTGPTTDVWDVMSTARTIRRFTDELVTDDTLARCLRAATWAPNGANAQGWRFIVLRSPALRAVVANAAAHAPEVIEPVYDMSRPGGGDDSRRARRCSPGTSWWAGRGGTTDRSADIPCPRSSSSTAGSSRPTRSDPDPSPHRGRGGPSN